MAGQQRGDDRPARWRPPRPGRRSRPPTAPPGDRPTGPRSRPPAPRRPTARARRRGAAAASRGRPRLQDPPGLVRAEDALLAEDVGEPGPALGRDARQLLVDAGSARRPRSASRGRGTPAGHGVGAEPRRQDVDRAFPAEAVGDLEQAQLGREVEAVARLRLDRRRLRGRASRRASAGRGPASSSSRGRARGRDRRQDPAAGGQDLEVAGAPLAQHELALSRLPAKSRWVWASIRPGVTVPPAASIRANRASGQAARPRGRARRSAPRADARGSGRPRWRRPGPRLASGATGPGVRAGASPWSAWLEPAARSPPASVATALAPDDQQTGGRAARLARRR